MEMGTEMDLCVFQLEKIPRSLVWVVGMDLKARKQIVGEVFWI